jgi:hypothetical protein
MPTRSSAAGRAGPHAASIGNAVIAASMTQIKRKAFLRFLSFFCLPPSSLKFSFTIAFYCVYTLYTVCSDMSWLFNKLNPAAAVRPKNALKSTILLSRDIYPVIDVLPSSPRKAIICIQDIQAVKEVSI